MSAKDEDPVGLIIDPAFYRNENQMGLVSKNLWFVDETEIFNWLDGIFIWIQEITLLPDSNVISISFMDSNYFKTDKLILGEHKKIWTLETFKNLFMQGAIIKDVECYVELLKNALSYNDSILADYIIGKRTNNETLRQALNYAIDYKYHLVAKYLTDKQI
jgi:hypothetical protein